MAPPSSSCLFLPMDRGRRTALILGAGSLAGGFLLGVAAVYLATAGDAGMNRRLARDSYNEDRDVTDVILDGIKQGRLRENLRWIAKMPHRC